jgi:hypothetical protein
MNKIKPTRDWPLLIRQQAAGILSVRDFCRQKKINPSRFYAKRKDLLQGQGHERSFVAIAQTAQVNHGFGSGRIMIEYNNFKVYPNNDSALLAMVLRIIREVGDVGL